MKRKHDKRMAHQLSTSTANGQLAIRMHHDKGAEMMFIFGPSQAADARKFAAQVLAWAKDEAVQP